MSEESSRLSFRSVRPQVEDRGGAYQTEDEARWIKDLSDLPELTIIHLIYQQKAYEGHAKDYEFSGTSMREHWQSGYEDTQNTLKQRQWLELPPDGGGIWVHDVHSLAEGLRRGA